MLGAVSITTVGIALVASFATTTIDESSAEGQDEKGLVETHTEKITRNVCLGYERDYDDFNTPIKAFETLFYAMLGTVEEDVCFVQFSLFMEPICSF